MLYPYNGPLDRAVWKLVFPTGEYAMTPVGDRPGGPVLFTSPQRARSYLAYHADRWQPLDDAQIEPVPAGLAAFVASWRATFGSSPLFFPYSLLYLDPREPFGFSDEFDADVLALNPSHESHRS